MDDHPKCKEKLTKEGSPRLVATIDGIGDAGNHPNHVYYEKGCGGDEKGGPFEHVELGKVSIFVRGLGGDSKVGVNSSKHFEQALEDSKEMRRDTTNDPKLFVPPPLIDSNATPPHLQDSSSKDGKEEGDEPYACKVTDLQA